MEQEIVNHLFTLQGGANIRPPLPPSISRFAFWTARQRHFTGGLPRKPESPDSGATWNPL
jgi:hypothetical protein